jgi:hypothetical protein
MKRLFAVASLLGATALPAQSFWDTSVRLAPQLHSYDIKTPFNEKISEFSLPLFVIVPVLPTLNIDVGTAFAIARLERKDGSGATQTSELSGLTDTQVRANYTFGQDFLVLTLGANLPTGSATVGADEIEAASRIGSDFLSFPISGFGSGLGFTGGLAVAQPVGTWNVGFGASMRHSSEYEPFRDAAGTTLKFTPGPEYRARLGADHPFGTGRISVGLTCSKFGDDKSNAAVFNTGDRYVAQVAMNNSLNSKVDYSLVMWNLYRSAGTLINGSASPYGNITNALMSFGLRGPADVGIEPSIETRLWTQQGSKTSYLASFGMRLYVNRGRYAIVPGVGFSMGAMEAATLTGYRATLGMRLGG